MKLLSKRISQISKSALLFNLLLSLTWAQTPKGDGPAGATLVSSDRYLMKIVDRTLSFQDVVYQQRNLRALDCVFDDSIVVQYFGKDIISNLQSFIKNFPQSDENARKYLHSKDDLLKKLRFFFKMLRYSEDQKAKISSDLTRLIRQSTRENNCEADILHKDTLKTNFLNLLQMELYMRSRYGGQLKTAKNFDVVRPSIDLFVESLDKQFAHEYYW